MGSSWAPALTGLALFPCLLSPTCAARAPAQQWRNAVWEPEGSARPVQFEIRNRRGHQIKTKSRQENRNTVAHLTDTVTLSLISRHLHHILLEKGFLPERNGNQDKHVYNPTRPFPFLPPPTLHPLFDSSSSVFFLTTSSPPGLTFFILPQPTTDKVLFMHGLARSDFVAFFIFEQPFWRCSISPVAP